jgi:rhodanese-related sulfurtransferase
MLAPLPATAAKPAAAARACRSDIDGRPVTSVVKMVGASMRRGAKRGAWAAIRDVALLGSVSIAIGLAAIAAHGLPFVAPPPTDVALACGDEGGLVASSDAAGEPVVPRISVGDVAAGLGRPGMTVVDARAGDAFTQGHIPGALHVPAFGAENLLQSESLPIPPEDLVVVYCDGDAAELSDYLGSLLRAQVGCREVRVIEGGWDAWLDAGAPVEGDLASG